MSEAIRCSRCARDLPLEAFAPSHRKPGCWCRPCRKVYMAAYWERRPAPGPLHGPRQPVSSRICRECGLHTGRRFEVCIDCAPSRSASMKAFWATRHETWQVEGLFAFMAGIGQPRYAESPDRRRKIAMRQARQRSGDKPTVQRLALRDGWSCHLCGARVDPSLIGTKDKMRPSVDHLVPISDGGLDEMANTRIAHLRCNARRGAGGTVQLLLVG